MSSWYGRTAEERFWLKVEKKDDSDSCWLWKRGLNGAGYGHFAYQDNKKTRTLSAHCYSYMLAHGPIPKGLVVRHKCNNPLCVRPDHLILGTHKDNSQDAIRAGAYLKKGCLGRVRAKEIAKLLLTQDCGMPTLARRYGVSYIAIYQIKVGRSYRGVMQEALAELTQSKSVSPPAKVELTPS